MNATKYIAVRVDEENNAEAWWDALDAAYPRFADSLRRNLAAVIDADLWDRLAGLPGFEDGPDHAPTALIDCGGEGEEWAAVVGGQYGVFETLD